VSSQAVKLACCVAEGVKVFCWTLSEESASLKQGSLASGVALLWRMQNRLASPVPAKRNSTLLSAKGLAVTEAAAVRSLLLSGVLVLAELPPPPPPQALSTAASIEM
jgi:hypothetical protein